VTHSFLYPAAEMVSLKHWT